MKKTNRNKIEEFIRVDHAGERGAIKIYEGQLLALNTFIKDDKLKKMIEEIKKRNIKPTKLLPLWDLLGVGLGFGSAIMGKKATMLCAASVKEVIDGHYKNQLDRINSDEKILKEKIKKFRNDEIHHKNTTYDNGASKEGLCSIFDKIIKTSSKIAINISEKI